MTYKSGADVQSRGKVVLECVVLLSPCFLLSSSLETDLELFMICGLLLEAKKNCEVGRSEAAPAQQK